MVRVRLLMSRAVLGDPQNMGDEIEVSAAEAERMVDAGQAVILRRVMPENTAKRVKSEKAVR